LAPGEAFCGSCGTSRAIPPGEDLQSKWATLWNLKKASESGFPAPGLESDMTDSLIGQSSDMQRREAAKGFENSNTLPEEVSEPPDQGDGNDTLGLSESLAAQPAPEVSVDATEDKLILAPPPKPPEYRVWLHSIAVSPPAVQLRGFWRKTRVFARTHRGDLALGASLVLFLITIVWAVSSTHSTTSADTGTSTAAASAAPAKPKRKQPPPAPKLGFFDGLLVDMGLAEAPPAPSYSGNPNVPVWVDVHTALYYCPGSDLYGKTAQGKIASQRDAQQDQFEPASRKVCE